MNKAQVEMSQILSTSIFLQKYVYIVWSSLNQMKS